MQSADSELILAIYACVTSDEAMRRCLEMLAARFACVSAALIYQDETRAAADIAFGHGVVDEAAQARYRAEFARYDPAPAAMAALDLGSVTATGRLFDDEDPRHRHFLSNFYHPLGLREALGGPVARQDGQFGIVAVQRGPDRGPFDDADIAGFERLMPHFLQAIRLRRTFFHLEQRAKDLSSIVETIGPGVLILGPDRRLAEANVAARTILNRRDGIILDPRGYVFLLANPEDNRFERLLDARVPLRSVRRNGGGGGAMQPLPYTVRLTRSDRARDAIIARIHDPDRNWPDAERTLTAAFGLSQPAAALTLALIAGDDLASYGKRAGITLNTVKFHLKTAFAATGTSRQADLVRRTLSVISDVSK